MVPWRGEVNAYAESGSGGDKKIRAREAKTREARARDEVNYTERVDRDREWRWTMPTWPANRSPPSLSLHGTIVKIAL